MNTKAKVMIRAGTALALTSFIWAGAAMAQDDTDVTRMPTPADDAASCDEMNWNKELAHNYPWVSEACHAVVVVNGEKWARFEGEFKRANRDGSFDTEFLSRSNRELGRVTLVPRPGQRAHIGNKDVRFSDLSRDQVLSFYVPEGAMGFAVQPGVPSEELAQVAQTADEPQLAQADTREEEPASRLPTTAGPLPMIALGGLMALLGGLGMTLRRKLSRRNS